MIKKITEKIITHRYLLQKIYSIILQVFITIVLLNTIGFIATIIGFLNIYIINKKINIIEKKIKYFIDIIKKTDG